MTLGVTRALALLALVLAFVSACRHGPANASSARAAEPPSLRELEYDLWLDESMESLTIRVCFEGATPQRLTSRRDAGDYVTWARTSGDETPLEVRGDEILLPDLPSDACIEYAVALQKLARQASRTRGALVGEDVIASPDLWLFFPVGLERDVEGTLQIHLPEGMRAAVPWPLVEGTVDTYHLNQLAFRWRAHVAFGRFEIDELEVAHARFRIAVLDAEHAATREGIHEWIRTAGETVAQLYDGRFPVEELTLVVVPLASGWGGGPVYFGHVTRGGGASALLLLDGSAQDSQLVGEWVAVHEMLHLGMPYVRPADAWLSEGFVTYYTQILRARARIMPGRLEEGEAAADGQARLALEFMQSGFERARSNARGRTLERASETMHQTGGYPRVYWGGAAIAFAADVQIRSASAGKRSLDDAMRAIQKLCTSPQVWRADDIVSRMDRAVGGAEATVSPIGEIAKEHLEARTVPDLGDRFEMIGVGLSEESGASAVEIRDAPPAARQLRAGLFSP